MRRLHLILSHKQATQSRGGLVNKADGGTITLALLQLLWAGRKKKEKAFSTLQFSTPGIKGTQEEQLNCLLLTALTPGAAQGCCGGNENFKKRITMVKVTRGKHHRHCPKN